MKPIIFLDIDGVLNDQRTYAQMKVKQTPFCMEPDLVARLDEIVRRSSAEIVISSSWRHAKSPREISAVLRENGSQFAHEVVVGATLKDWSVDERHEQIRAWLITNRPGLDRFSILEDVEPMFDLEPHTVRQQPDSGITAEDVDRAVEILKGAA